MKKLFKLSIITIFGLLFLCSSNSYTQNWFPSDTSWITDHNYTHPTYPPSNIFDNDNDTISYGKCSGMNNDTSYVYFEFDEYKNIDHFKYIVWRHSCIWINMYYYDNYYEQYQKIYSAYFNSIDIFDTVIVDINVIAKKWKYEILFVDNYPLPSHLKTYDITFSELISPPVIIIDPENQFICKNNNALFTVECSGVELSYQWYKDDIIINGATDSELEINNVTFDDEGLYNCIITNMYGTDTSEYAELDINEVNTGNIYGSNIVSPNEIVIYNIDYSNGSTYEWNVDKGVILANNNDSIIVQWGNTICTGYVKVIETSIDGCIGDPVVMWVGVGTVGVDELKEVNIKVYPNPVVDLVNIEKDGLNTLYLYSIDGKFLIEKQFENKNILNISNLPKGVYIYRIGNNIGKIIK